MDNTVVSRHTAGNNSYIVATYGEKFRVLLWVDHFLDFTPVFVGTREECEAWLLAKREEADVIGQN